MTAIHPGQIYESCLPTYYGSAGEEHTRIRVIGKPSTTPGVYGFGKVRVATLTESGRELRPRMVEMARLHATGSTESGEPRRTGYRLIEDVPAVTS